MIAKFSSKPFEYTVDTNDYKEKTVHDYTFRIYKLKRDGYEQDVRAVDVKELKFKLKRNGFVFEGFVVEESVQ